MKHERDPVTVGLQCTCWSLQVVLLLHLLLSQLIWKRTDAARGERFYFLIPRPQAH